MRTQLPQPPAAVLEVGCGSGELALALSAEGWMVTAVDPKAPEGPPFVRTAVEDLNAADHGPFDAAVAVLSLHHAGVVGTVLDKVRSLLRPGGIVVVDEFRKEHLADRATAAFFYHQQLALIHAGRKGIGDGGHGGHRPGGGSFESWYARILERRAGVHEEGEVLEALEERFVTRSLSYGPTCSVRDSTRRWSPWSASSSRRVASGPRDCAGSGSSKRSLRGRGADPAGRLARRRPWERFRPQALR